MRDYEYSDLYFDSHLDKQMQIEVVGTGIMIDNSMIELDAFELNETLCTEQALTFGSCEANCVKFTARDMPGSIVGKTIRITEAIDGNTVAPFPYGVYKVYSDVPTSDRTKREITAYDAMYDIVNADVKQWYAGLSFPMTLRQFRDSFFTYMVISQKETTLVNDEMTVNKTLVAMRDDGSSVVTEESSISGKQIITAICEINGVFGNINCDGEFEYVELEQITNPLYPSNDLYPSDDLFPRDPNTISMTGHYITFDYEDYQTRHITQLEIRASDESAGALVGTEGNNYVISNNFLIADKTSSEIETIAANTLSIIKKASYTPIKSAQVVGNPCIELGDPIRFNTTREIVESYVLQRTLTGIQSKRDQIVSPGVEVYSQNPNGIKAQLASVQRRTNKLERTADHTLSELKDLDANTSSRFEQTAEQMQQEVLYRESADSEIRASLTLKIDKTDDGTIISLINGSADKIHFNANNMFTIASPNIIIDEAGNVEIGGKFVADTQLNLCYEYASLPNISYASKVNVLKIDGGTFEKYYITKDGVLIETNSAVGMSLPLLLLGADPNIQAIITDKQFQAESIYSPEGIFDDLALDYTSGTYGGRVYKCCMSFGDDGIASPGWVKNYVSNNMPNTSNFAKANHTHENYVNDASYSFSDSPTTKYAPRYFGVSGNMLYVSGLLIATSSSDKRLKDNIAPLRDIHALYMCLYPVEYTWKDGYVTTQKGVQFGLIAQDLEESLYRLGIADSGLILKEVAEEDERNIHGDEITYKIDKENLHAMHIQMIQLHEREIECLKQENLALKNQISILESEMEEFKNVIYNKNN